MRSVTPVEIPARLSVLVSLAQCLEHVEQSGLPVDADQYLNLVIKLGDALSTTKQDESLSYVLNAFPATATLYENLQYQHAGLCRSSLDLSLSAEIATRALLSKVR
jgi:hypothetical protein